MQPCADPVARARCDVEATLSIIEGKSRLMLVRFVRDQPRRCRECRRQFPEVSQEVAHPAGARWRATGWRAARWSGGSRRGEFPLTPFGRSLAPGLAALDA